MRCVLSHLVVCLVHSWACKLWAHWACKLLLCGGTSSVVAECFHDRSGMQRISAHTKSDGRAASPVSLYPCRRTVHGRLPAMVDAAHARQSSDCTNGVSWELETRLDTRCTLPPGPALLMPTLSKRPGRVHCRIHMSAPPTPPPPSHTHTHNLRAERTVDMDI